MDCRTRIAAIGNLASRLVLLADAYLAAVLDRRPLIRIAEDLAAWLGRTWRSAAAEARTRRHGPGRGVIAVVITRPTREDTTDV